MYHSGEAQTDLTVPCSQIGNGSSPKIPNPYARGPPYASLNIHKPVSLWQAPSDKDSSLKTSTMSQKGCSDLALRGQICILQIVDSWRVLKDFRTTLKTLYVAQIISKRLGSKDFWRVVKKDMRGGLLMWGRYPTGSPDSYRWSFNGILPLSLFLKIHTSRAHTSSLSLASFWIELDKDCDNLE